MPLGTSVIEVLRRPVELALAAPVGVEDHALGWPASDERHLQGVFDQLGSHVVGQRAQPTLRRLARSMTPARYAQPSQVMM